MSKKWITILLAAVVGAFLLPTTALAATLVGNCNVSIVNNLTVVDTAAGKTYTDPSPYPAGDTVGGLTVNLGAALNVNAEGTLERVADILITDANTGTPCFPANGDIIITFNGTMNLPPTPGNLSFTNFDIYDSKGLGGLTITSATVSQVFAANTTNSQIDLHIGQPGTSGANILTGTKAVPVAGSGVRVKNIRLNASTAAGTCNAIAGINICASFGGTAFQVAAVLPTLTAGSVAQTPTVGSGTQSSGKGLLGGNAQVAMTEGFPQSFRFAGGPCTTVVADAAVPPPPPAAADTCYSQVAADIATAATSLTFSVTGIPSGVTVTFPSSMSTSAIAAATAATSMTFASRSGSTLSNSGAPGAVTVTYDNANTFGENTAANSMTVQTADNADPGTSVGTTAGTSNPNCKIDATPALVDLNTGSKCNANPKIGVKIASTSLSGTAKLWWVFGPAVAGSTPLFTGDDVAANATLPPQYTTAARILVNNKSFFTINPTRTTLLFPFVSTRGGWNSGVEVANTGNDAGVFAATATSQIGGITLFFFGDNPNTGAVVTDSVNSDLTASGSTNLSSACIGLDATGRVAAGATAACSIASLLPLLPTKPTGFEGYVIAVSGFNFAHGFSVVFNASGAPFAAQNALVLGLNGSTARVGTESLGQ